MMVSIYLYTYTETHSLYSIYVDKDYLSTLWLIAMPSRQRTTHSSFLLEENFTQRKMSKTRWLAFSSFTFQLFHFYFLYFFRFFLFHFCSCFFFFFFIHFSLPNSICIAMHAVSCVTSLLWYFLYFYRMQRKIGFFFFFFWFI